MTTEELRRSIVDGIDATLEAPWIVRRWLSPESLRILRATRRYWMSDDGTQLDKLLALVDQEPVARQEPTMTKSKPKTSVSASQCQALASKMGISWPPTPSDWQTIIQVLLMILQALQQPKPMQAKAGCEDTCDCCLECAAGNLEIAQCLLEHAHSCCPAPAPTPPTP